MTLLESLQTVVGSGMISRNNHTRDNSFFERRIDDAQRKMEQMQLEPVGICLNVPFPSNSDDFTVAYVFKDEGETYWCHLPQVYWFSLLKQNYGYDKADEIIRNII